jgi:hypothetical protein
LENSVFLCPMGHVFFHRNFNFPMFWKLNLKKKYEKISVNAFDYGKLHEIPNILPLHMIWQLSEWRRKICKHWNYTFKTGFYWGSCNSIFSFISMFCTFVFVLMSFFLWPLSCLSFFDLRILITPFWVFSLKFK